MLSLITALGTTGCRRDSELQSAGPNPLLSYKDGRQLSHFGGLQFDGHASAPGHWALRSSSTSGGSILHQLVYTDDTNHCNIKLDLFIVIVIRRGCSKYIPTFIINYNLTPSKLIILSKEISSPALLFIVNLGLKFAWAVIISVSESCGLDQSSVLLSAVKRSIGFTISFHNHGEGPY